MKTINILLDLFFGVGYQLGNLTTINDDCHQITIIDSEVVKS